MKKRSREVQEERSTPAKRTRQGKPSQSTAVTVRKTRAASSEQAAPASRAASARSAKQGKHVPAPAAGADAKAASAPAGGAESAGASAIVKINRAPVLTLWVAVVAERQGFSWEEGLTFGRYISGLLAHSKGKSLGMYEDKEKSEEEIQTRKQRDREMGVHKVEVFGMKAPAVREGGAGGERRAVSQGKPIQPGGVESYLERSFGEGLQPAKTAMQALAAAIAPDRIGKVCYSLYERFRPPWQGWGQKGELDLQAIRAMAGDWQQEA